MTQMQISDDSRMFYEIFIGIALGIIGVKYTKTVRYREVAVQADEVSGRRVFDTAPVRITRLHAIAED